MRRLRIATRIIVGDQNHIGGAVIDEWSAESYGCPVISNHSDATAKHLITRGNRNPIGLAREAALRCGLHIEVVGTGLLCTLIVESYAGNKTCAT